LLGITGLAPAAKVLPIAVPISGTEDAAPSDSIPAAIHYAADKGAKIISMSLGGKRQPGVDSLPCPAVEQAAIDYAITKGAIVVAAAGNSGQSGSPVEDPGVCLGVISVGAVDRNGVVAPFSSRHSYLTVTAPGVNVASLGRTPGTAYSGYGTSQATAITSAVLALVWSKYPDLSGRQIVARLLATLDRRQAARDPAYGFGRVNAEAAVTAPVPANAPNPVYAALDPFVARDHATSAGRTDAPPPPMPVQAIPPGQFDVGPVPGPINRRVIAGIAAAGCGLVALLGLAWVSRRNRRRRHAQHTRGGGRSPYPSDELTWYDVSASPRWATPPDAPS
jgi:subtilisin family serine protease